MSRILSIVLLASSALAMDLSRMPSALGDARFGGWNDVNITSDWPYLDVAIPCDCNELTCMAWMRLNTTYTSAFTARCTTGAFYCPENIRRSNPDLLQGRGGFPTNTMLSGSITMVSFPWQPYTDKTSSNYWTRGVYTVAGWASNSVTVTLGGQDVTVGPGAFNRNVIPGPSDSCVISGSGLISIGVSRTPDSQWFQKIDGVLGNVGGQTTLTDLSIVTNELTLCVWRLRLNSVEHVYRSDLIQFSTGSALGSMQTNAMPRTARSFSRNGYYKFGLTGFKPEIVNLEWFDFRCYPWWLSDAEIMRVRENGLEEIQRRGIPRFK